MKKIFLLPLLSVLVIFSCGNNENPEPEPVYVDKPIRIVVNYNHGDAINEITKEYDDFNRVIKDENKFYEKGTLYSDVINQYTYNDHNDLLHQVGSENGQNVINITYTYEYDENGNINVKVAKGNQYTSVMNTKDVYQYDEFNRATSYEYYSGHESVEDEPSIKAKYLYTYTKDKPYKEYETEIYYNYLDVDDPSTPYRTTMQFFDGKGDLTSTIVLDKESKLFEATSYIFDEYHCKTSTITILPHSNNKTVFSASYYKNNKDKPSITTEKEYDISESGEEILESTTTTTYEYDAHDRVKKETETNGLPTDDPRMTTTYYYEVE